MDTIIGGNSVRLLDYLGRCDLKDNDLVWPVGQKYHFRWHAFGISVIFVR